MQVTAECGPVLRHIFAGGLAAGHTDAQFLQAHCVGPCRSRYNWRTSTACIYGYTGLAWRNRSSIINRLLQNEHRL